MINKCQFIGRLGKDVEVRYSQGGDAVATFSMACSEKWKDRNGQPQERTEWVNCTAFKRLAEVCGEYLRKGSLVYVEGKMQTDKYEKDGVMRYSTKIIIREMKMLDSKGSSDSGQGNHQQGQDRSSTQREQTPPPIDDDFGPDFNDSVPF